MWNRAKSRYAYSCVIYINLHLSSSYLIVVWTCIVNLKNSVGRATFYVKPSMTKHEVKEYLTKIYGVEVYKVETANFLGKPWRISFVWISCRTPLLNTLFSLILFYILCSCYVHLATGRWKRFYGKKKIVAYKRRNFKKAYVSFLNLNIQDAEAKSSS